MRPQVCARHQHQTTLAHARHGIASIGDGSGASSPYTLGLDARDRDSSPPQLLARAMTLNFSGLIAIQGLGFALAGAVAQAIGPGDAIATAGLCGVAVTVALMRDELFGLLRHRPLALAGR